MGVTVDVSELKAFSKKLESLAGSEKELFFQLAVKDLAGRLLALVIPRTPVRGGTLRRGWTASVDGLSITSAGGTYTIEIVNPVEYASYVEYGHRQTPGRYVPAIGKRLKASWVNGQFFLTLSEQELQGMAPSALQALLDRFLRTVF